MTGRKPGKEIIASFDEWSAVMGGILASASIPGFLANRDAFNAGESEEKDDNTYAMQRLLTKHKLEPFTALEAFGTFSGKYSSDVSEPVRLPFNPREDSDSFNGQETGKWLAKLRTTYDLVLAGETVRVEFVKCPRSSRGATYAFVSRKA